MIHIHDKWYLNYGELNRLWSTHCLLRWLIFLLRPFLRDSDAIQRRMMFDGHFFSLALWRLSWLAQDNVKMKWQRQFRVKLATHWQRWHWHRWNALNRWTARVTEKRVNGVILFLIVFLGAPRWMKMKDFVLEFRLCVQAHLMDFYFRLPFVATSALIFLYWHSANCMNSWTALEYRLTLFIVTSRMTLTSNTASAVRMRNDRKTRT